MELFEELLTQLSQTMGIPLKIDTHGTCLIALDKELQVYLEPDKDPHQLIIGIVLGRLSPGKLRENFMKAALQANNAPYPNYGTFAYSRRTDQFVLFDRLYMDKAEGKMILDHLMAFADKAKLWKLALQTGRFPIKEQPQAKGAAGAVPKDNLFGLKP